MKQIPLHGKHGTGEFALVDDSDYDFLNRWEWSLAIHRSGYRYVKRNICFNCKSISTRMSRQIMGITDPTILVDHIDGNPLNNQRSNLRFATDAENQLNRQKPKGKYTSDFRGVALCKKSNKWIAKIKVLGIHMYLGAFVNEVDAAKAYNEAAKKHHGEFAGLNKLNPV